MQTRSGQRLDQALSLAVGRRGLPAPQLKRQKAVGEVEHVDQEDGPMTLTVQL